MQRDTALPLEDYQRKRDFRKTPEPKGGEAAAAQGLFVVQKHAARRLHFDFRLELDGVLKSWAVTKSPSYDPRTKRLAVHVEDHPLEYGGFEGVIPKGEYGGGTVLLWDRGRWFPEGDPHQGLAQGKLSFRLEGHKLRGKWALVRLKGKPADKHPDRHWLLIKERDDLAAETGGTVDEASPDSVASGRDMEQIASDSDRVWHSDRAEAPAAEVPGARPGPLPERVEPQLATLADEAPDGDDWLHEIKFDGYRALCRIAGGTPRMITRGGLDWTEKFAALAKAAAALPSGQALLDGEVVVLDRSGASHFEALQQAISEGRDDRMIYMVFDLLYLDGIDLRDAPLIERKALLKTLIPPGEGGPIRYSDHVVGQGPAFRRQTCTLALEGAVSKRRDKPYRPGRSRDWIKAKCGNRQEFVIGGYTRPQGARTGLGALLIGTFDGGALIYAGKVGTGFTEAMLDDLLGRLRALKRDDSPFAAPPPERQGVTWVEPKLVAEVEFSNWTRDGVLRHPSFQGLRLDKEAAQVVRETRLSAAATDGEGQRRADLNLTNPDRVLYPRQGITKSGLASYYLEVADWILPHIVGRPLTLVRCPQGQEKECFYQRHAMKGMSKAVRQVAGAADEEPFLAIDDVEGLLALVQIGVLEIHMWGCRADRIDSPDRLVFDLDPDEGLPWRRVVDAARDLRERLKAMGLESFVKTTGGKGLHVLLPINRKHDWDEVKRFTKAVVEAMAADDPGRYTANMAKAKRGGKIFVDYLRNQRAATFVAPYSTRAKPGAPVSVPLAWEELDTGIQSDHFTVETLFRRLGGLTADPWAGVDKVRQSITQAAKRKVGL